jgi:hypothetical protein
MDSNGGASARLLGPVHFRPLPANAEAVAINLIKSIT